MNSILVLVCIGITLFIFQAIFFISCIKWLANSKKKRDREFAILDAERAKLIELQARLKDEVAQAKNLADDTLKKLKIIGTEAHAEWEDVTKKINDVLVEVDNHSEKLLENNISKLNVQKMSLEKSIINAYQINNILEENTHKAHKILKLFDSNLPTDEVLKELQASKYDEAKRMLTNGVEASTIAKKLGISLGEIVTLSSFI